jgi:hypothetical protein
MWAGPRSDEACCRSPFERSQQTQGARSTDSDHSVHAVRVQRINERIGDGGGHSGVFEETRRPKVLDTSICWAIAVLNKLASTPAEMKQPG